LKHYRLYYRPENIRTVDKASSRDRDKSCALSARDDGLATMKITPSMRHASRNDGRATVTADGAPQLLVRDHERPLTCCQLLCILDWFHIAMRFQNVRSAVVDAYTDTLERVKWTLWHGKPKETLSKLELLITNVTQSQKRSKLQRLYDYLKNNEAYLVNYEERGNRRTNHTPAKSLKLTLIRLLMSDIKRVRKCNGLVKGP